MSGRQTVYFIEHPHGPVKVGTSKDPESRLGDLQIGSPYRLELRTTVECVNDVDGRTVERELHDYYWKYSDGYPRAADDIPTYNGEWFFIPEPDLEVFDEVDVLVASDIIEATQMSHRTGFEDSIGEALTNRLVLAYNPKKRTP